MNHSKMLVAMFSTAVSALFVGGCDSFKTESYWGPAQKLSGLGGSYGWRPGAECEPGAVKVKDSDLKATFQGRLDAELEAKGFRRASDGSADFLVCYRLGTRVEQAETGHASWDEAVLEVDLTDPATGGLVWRGRVRGRIDYAAAPDARSKRIDTAARQLLKPLRAAGRG